MDAVTNIPGVDSPMEGGVTTSFGYTGHSTPPTTRLWTTPPSTAEPMERSLPQVVPERKGLPDDGHLEGPPNPIWDHWLDHPDYDAYWQAMVPYRQQFAAIDIPVLTTTGYYDGGQIGALYALTQQEKYNRGRRTISSSGPTTTTAAIAAQSTCWGRKRTYWTATRSIPPRTMDIGELSYRWFDYIFKGGAKPARLQDKINYEVMGADMETCPVSRQDGRFSSAALYQR